MFCHGSLPEQIGTGLIHLAGALLQAQKYPAYCNQGP
jgi:hypothetical protein